MNLSALTTRTKNNLFLLNFINAGVQNTYTLKGCMVFPKYIHPLLLLFTYPSTAAA